MRNRFLTLGSEGFLRDTGKPGGLPDHREDDARGTCPSGEDAACSEGNTRRQSCGSIGALYHVIRAATPFSFGQRRAGFGNRRMLYFRFLTWAALPIAEKKPGAREDCSDVDLRQRHKPAPPALNLSLELVETIGNAGRQSEDWADPPRPAHWPTGYMAREFGSNLVANSARNTGFCLLCRFIRPLSSSSGYLSATLTR